MAQAVDAAEELVWQAQRRRFPAASWIEPCPRWIRAYAGGVKVVDTRRALLVFERGPVPAYWVPFDDVRRDLMDAEARSEQAPTLIWTLRAGKRVIEKAARSYRNPTDALAPLHDHVSFFWDQMDAWYEEDDEVYVEPRNPYHRVDVLHSSRHIEVRIGGELIADTHRPSLLFETVLPTRYYIPRQDVRMELLEPSDTTSVCPYKGTASYFSARIAGETHKDIAWSYPRPIPECAKIENLISFYNEHVDITIDGEPEPRPVTEYTQRR